MVLFAFCRKEFGTYTSEDLKVYILCSEILLPSPLLGMAEGLLSAFGVGARLGAELKNLSGQQIMKMLSLLHLVKIKLSLGPKRSFEHVLVYVQYPLSLPLLIIHSSPVEGNLLLNCCK